MGNLLTYSAITAKLKAMSGRLLTDEDFRKLAFSDNVSAAVEALKSCPSYSGMMIRMSKHSTENRSNSFYGFPCIGISPASTVLPRSGSGPS